MEKIDSAIDSFLKRERRYPEYMLLSPPLYEELKSYLGLDWIDILDSYKDIQIYTSPSPDPIMDIKLL